MQDKQDARVIPGRALFRMWERHGEPPIPAVVHVGDQWLVTRHSLVRQILADPVTFGPDNALDAVTPMTQSALRILTRYGFRLPPTMANNGTPTHSGLRAVVGQALHSVRVDAQRAWLTGLVRRRVVRLAMALRAGHQVDLYAELAQDLPLAVLGRLIDLPDDDVRVVKEFSVAALELFWAPLDVDRQRVLAKQVGEYHARLRAFARSAPGFVAQLREHTAGQDFGEDIVVGVLFFLLVAGQETTSQFLGLLLHRLLRERQILTQLAQGMMSSADVVEEALRFEPPIVTWRRITSRDVELAGVVIPRGASIVLCLAEVGRDRAVVADPGAFIPNQPGSRRHVAFGAGIHRCLGAQLARMEAQVVVAEVAPLLRLAKLVREPRYPDNLSFRIPDALLIMGTSGKSAH